MSQKFIMVGNLGNDPELRRTAGGDAVTNFSMATTKKLKDKADQATWIRMVAWKRQAEIIEQYAKKGTQLYVEGEFRERSWDKDGQTHRVLECHVREFQFLGGKPDDVSHGTSGQQGTTKREPAKNNDFDDDIPF